MATLGFMVAALFMLAGAGWLIGRDIEQGGSVSGAAPIHVVMRDGADGRAEKLAAALLRAGLERHAFLISAEPPEAGLFVRVSCVQRDGWEHITCRPSILTPTSFALQHLEFPTETLEPGWDVVADHVIRHADRLLRRTGSVSVAPGAPLFATRYRSAWRKWINHADSDQLHIVIEDLRCALDVWPEDRVDERAVAMANLALLCLSATEPPQTRLPRRLEGLDLARTALKLQYVLPVEARMTGLRDLVRALRDAVADHRPEQVLVLPPSVAPGPRRGARTIRATRYIGALD